MYPEALEDFHEEVRTMDENGWQHSVAGKDAREHEVVGHHSSSVGEEVES
jgi:hypothetical protein